MSIVPENAEWKAQRHSRWQTVWERALRVDGVSKNEKKIEDQIVEAQKNWYINGDLEPLLNLPDSPEKEDALGFQMFMQLCPAAEINIYLSVFERHASRLSKNKIQYWGAEKEYRDERFLKGFFHLYTGEHSDSTPNIYAHMLNMFLPDKTGKVMFPLGLGEDVWQPSIEVILSDYAFDILSKLRRYLFCEPSNSSYSHLVSALPLVTFIKDLPIEYFSTTLMEGKSTAIDSGMLQRPVTKAGQKIIRRIIGNLLGYSEDSNVKLHHNDIEAEEKINNLINGLDMPNEYHELVNFIHDNPERFLRYSC